VACGAARVVPAAKRIRPARNVRVLICIPSHTILTVHPEVEKHLPTAYNS
jgi:hypothetical protein